MNNDEKILQMLEEIQTDIKQMQTDMEIIKDGQRQHAELLNALIYRSDVHKHEIDKLNIEIVKVKALK